MKKSSKQNFRFLPFYVNGIAIQSFGYDYENQKVRLCDFTGKCVFRLDLSIEKYDSLSAKGNPAEPPVWNKLVELFGDADVVEEAKRKLANDKKKNMAYWDIIDDTCYEAVRGVAASSQTEIDEDELEDAITEIGAEIRDIIVEKLKAIGGTFPFVDENY